LNGSDLLPKKESVNHQLLPTGGGKLGHSTFQLVSQAYDQSEACIEFSREDITGKGRTGGLSRLLKKAVQKGRSELSLYKGWLG
jgi:hypothetical protein